MQYSDKLIDHFENPRNIGSLDENDTDVGTGTVGSPECGDVMKLQIRVGEDGRIAEVKFKTFGCGAAVASSSLASELLQGMTLDEARQLNNKQIVEELSLPAVKVHCSVLASEAINAAIDDWQAKHSN
jgi:nitrogen fixation protein NifU and related proteins